MRPSCDTARDAQRVALAAMLDRQSALTAEQREDLYGEEHRGVER